MLLPSALGFSPHPPVSVYGTGMCITIAAFLGTWLTCFPTLVRSTLRLRIVRKICCPYSYPACTGFFFPGSCSPHASPQFWVHIVQESPPVIHRLRLSTSPYAPTYPEQISFTLETLDIRPEGFSPSSRYSFRHSLFLKIHSSFRYCFVSLRMLLYQPLRVPQLRCCVSAPDIFGAGPLD